VDLQNNDKNCGKCAAACQTGFHCKGGACVANCQTGLTDCGGACVNLQTSFFHCGKCNAACKAGEVCANSKCALSCQAGLTNCNGVCVDLKTDNNNCNACGTVCPSGYVCSGGKCQLSCQSGQTNCNGSCRNLLSDNKNCGACGTACAANQACLAGKCTVLCGSGLTNCSGACKNLQTDVTNCGTCGLKCPAVSNGTPGCSGGACGIAACNTNYGDCDKKLSTGCETYLVNNNNHCGKCGNACGSGDYNSCSGWTYYCSGTKRYRKRTCYKRGCSGTSCYNTPWTHTELVQSCTTGSYTQYRCSGTARQSRTCTNGCYNNSCTYSCGAWATIQSCGSGDYNSCSGWTYYCSGTKRYRKRTCYKRGCSGTSCYNTPWTHTELVQSCSTGSFYQYRCSGATRQRRSCSNGCYNSSCTYSCGGWGNYQSCGSGSYNSCSGYSYYCSGNTVRKKRTCYKRGCSGTSCYNTAWTDDSHHQTCSSSQKCSGGACKQVLATINYPKISGRNVEWGAGGGYNSGAPNAICKYYGYNTAVSYKVCGTNCCPNRWCQFTQCEMWWHGYWRNGNCDGRSNDVFTQIVCKK